LILNGRGVAPLDHYRGVSVSRRDRALPGLAVTGIAGGVVEVIVVDNSVGDGGGEIVQRGFPWVRYLAPRENLGFGRANNLGYGQSSGESILFLNPDTISNAVALEHCLRRLQAEPDIGVISPKLVQADGLMDLACRRASVKKGAWRGENEC
jgi:GT2 family glycosyltransferase